MSDRAFDTCGPLPTGVTLLEASAGTGKTYTIAALAARYVAEGTPLDRLLLVTFTRMATGELRDRVRERLVSCEQGLARVAAGGEPGDEVVRLLAAAPAAEVAERRGRLARALSEFDAATIATTHGFCQEVLAGLGVVGDVEPDAEIVEDVDDLLAEVVDDLYLRKFRRTASPAFGRAEAMAIARAAIGNPAARLEPAAAAKDSRPALRYGLACAVHRELEARKRRAGVITYDDLLTRLATTLRGEGGAAAVDQLRTRYGVVLVDEFQDTDPVQWDILRRAFGQGGITLVLIGDPKQAIYAFRGADVYAYLEAARAAGARETLRVNWRSDQKLIDAYDALFGDARLGHEGILYREVRAADPDREPGLTGAPVTAPLRVRVVERGAYGTTLTRRGYAEKASTRDHVARDLAADVARLLHSGARVCGDPVRPGHLAVLVRWNKQAVLVRDALKDVGVPAVINGAGSVFATPPARDWLRLLEALERPASSLRAHLCALTAFFGWNAEEVACASEAAWEEVHARLHRWARVLRQEGVAALGERITVVEGLPRRVLAGAEGERTLTDLRHVGHLLHATARAEQLGPAALTAWLRRRIAEAGQDTSNEEHSRRLESDEEAVQVLTIHRSKGLEFPVVYHPFLWEPFPERKGEPVTFHDPAAADALTVDVALEGAEFDRHAAQQAVEQRGEELRLAYVALTRARHQSVLWWAGSYDTRHSALTRLLFARAPDGTVAASGAGTPADDEARARFEALAAQAPGCVSVEQAIPGLPTEWSSRPEAPRALAAAPFGRELDRRWRRTSFSDITAGAHEARVASEPEEPLLEDEPEAPVVVAAAGPGEDEAALRAVPSLLAGMPVGVRVGTFVHEVLEAADFAAADLETELGLRVAEAQARRGTEIGDPARVVAGLAAALRTPLGPLVGDVRLCDVARSDRLDELGFELPLVGGDAPSGRLTLRAIAAVLEEHLPAGDPLAGYAARLADPMLKGAVGGYLAGSLDLVARLPDGRYAVADYKTNRLAGPDEPLSAWHHRPSALAAEMRRAHYGLQALLYTAALHRFLRWRLPGYDPGRHLAGVVYLFLRGMTGGGTPRVGGTPCGVFAWRPPGALVEALSDVLDRGAAALDREVAA